MASSVRLIIITLIGLLFVLLIYLTAPQYSYEPKGMLLPAKTVLPPSSAAGVAFSTTSYPEAQKLGFISVEQHYVGGNPAVQARQIQALAQQLAASVGANLVWINGFYQPKRVGVLNDWNFQGYALHINKSVIPL